MLSLPITSIAVATASLLGSDGVGGGGWLRSTEGPAVCLVSESLPGRGGGSAFTQAPNASTLCALWGSLTTPLFPRPPAASFPIVPLLSP